MAGTRSGRWAAVYRRTARGSVYGRSVRRSVHRGRPVRLAGAARRRGPGARRTRRRSGRRSRQKTARVRGASVGGVVAVMAGTRLATVVQTLVEPRRPRRRTARRSRSRRRLGGEVEQRRVLAHRVEDRHRVAVDCHVVSDDRIEAEEDFAAVEDVQLEQRREECTRISSSLPRTSPSSASSCDRVTDRRRCDARRSSPFGARTRVIVPWVVAGAWEAARSAWSMSGSRIRTGSTSE